MKYFIIFIVLIFWLGGCSATMMRHLYKTGVIADDHRYGDLYRLSNLPQFKDPVHPCPDVYTVHRRTNVGSNLYVIGDSFTEPSRLSQQDFRVGQYLRVRWDDQLKVHLDTARQNVLLINTDLQNVILL